jgi:excinuclease ABC subunit A
VTDALITLRGVRVHNLKNVDVALPLGKLTLVTGLSGAGKSSLVFDTIHAEAQRRYLQSFSVAARQVLERFDQPEADWIGDLPPTIALRSPISLPASTVGGYTELDEVLGQLLSHVALPVCPKCGQSVKPHRTADVVSAIDRLPAGTRATIAFPDRPGEGETIAAWAARLREEGWVRLQVGEEIIRLDERVPTTIDDALVLTDRIEVGKATPERLFEGVETTYNRGDGRLVLLHDEQTERFDRRWRCPRCEAPVAEPTPRRFDPTDPLGACPVCHGRGIDKSGVCPACGGRRFNDESLTLRWQGRSIADLHEISIDALREFVASTEFAAEAKPIAARLIDRLAQLRELGLGHLSLRRDLESLALGEAQRMRLGQILAEPLVDSLYLFEEPTAGLHPSDVERVLPHILRLRDVGNTLIVIDHHPAWFEVADHLIDLGPGAGEEGGQILYQGDVAGLQAVEASLTATHLFADDEEPTTRRKRNGEIVVSDVNVPPLALAEVTFPLGVLCVVAGVSGAGKTRLVRDVLFPSVAQAKHKKFTGEPRPVRGASSIHDVFLIDRGPLPRSARSNPATYLKAFDDIRELFAETTDAKIRNFDAGAFSFNQSGGRCEACEGQGFQRVDMQFLADVRMTCPECLGTRYRKEILQVKVRGLSIAEVLDLTVREAFRFFRAQRSLEKKLKWLIDVGLDHVRLGQPLETLSGGEGQRLKLAGQLAASRKPGCLFLLLEPSAGLHPADIGRLLECFDQLLGTGHSLVIVDHHPEMLRNADHLIELGLGAGPEGGRLIAEGTPEEVAKANTPTGRFLRDTFSAGR